MIEGNLNREESKLDIDNLNKVKVKFDLMDIVFEQYMQGRMKFNTIVIIIQTLNLIIQILAMIFSKINPQLNNIINIITVVNLYLMGVVVVNCRISQAAWDKAKSRLKDVFIRLNRK